MTPQVKQRIEHIRRGEVPEGYKRTKAGVVPIEWEETRIGDVLTQRKTLQCVSEDTPLLSFTIEEGVIDPADKKSNKRDFLIKDMSTKKFALTEVGDIIYNPANLKFGAIHRNNLRRGVVSPIYGVFYGEQDSVFMGYLLHNQRFIDYAKVYTEGTVEKLKTLKAETFSKLKITTPTISEQHKIAEMLSLQDKVITLKEKLIEEKKSQKKALLQQLLTGQKRLVGFDDDFESVKLMDIFSFHKGAGLSKEKITPQGQFSCILYGELFTKYAEIINNVESRTDFSEGLKSQTYDVLMPGSTTTSGLDLATASVILTDDVLLGGDIVVLRPKEKNDTRFWGYLLRKIVKETVKHTQGVTIIHLNINTFRNAKVKIPKTHAEQTAIANILINADKEIELLQMEVDQEKQKKKALMQLLLTGIVRVNI